MKTIFFILASFILFGPEIQAETRVPLTIEFAASIEEKTWGLMQRSHLPENHGMLFLYDKPAKLTFWMFNTLIDLSVAFLDENSVITEIVKLKAYPEKMDPNRKVLNISDLKKYPFFDPILVFFYNNRVTSGKLSKYALEMRANWFEDHGIRVGDRLIWRRDTSKAYIYRSELEIWDFGFEKTSGLNDHNCPYMAHIRAIVIV